MTDILLIPYVLGAIIIISTISDIAINAFIQKQKIILALTLIGLIAFFFGCFAFGKFLFGFQGLIF